MQTMASSAASPCSGPSRSVIATARLSATTGLIRSGGWFRTCAASRIAASASALARPMS
jgi:arylsulfatase A-like enzyme